MIYTLSTNLPYPRPDGLSFRRKVDQQLLDWIHRPNHKPIVLKGLRQIGKSFALLKFAKENFDSVIYIDFRHNPELGSIFYNYDVDQIKARLSAILPNVRFPEDHKTIFFFDEIQDCPKARGSLKYFSLDGRYEVISSGSMLGVEGYAETANDSIPVGFEEIWTMHPMDFEEFLWAQGIDDYLVASFHDSVRSLTPIDPVVHEFMLRTFRNYIVVGGLPAAVQSYNTTKNFQIVFDTQRMILSSYSADFGRHLGEDGGNWFRESEKAKIKAVFASIPSQLSKANTKFQYATMNDPAAKGTKYQGPIQWLVDYGVLLRSSCLRDLDLAQAGYVNPLSFKLYFADTGFFASSLDSSIPKAIIFNDFGTFKGAIYENIIADGFSKADRPLFYYEPNFHCEVDFVTHYRGKTALVEVKSSRGETSSSRTLLKASGHSGRMMILKFSSKNIGFDENFINLPYYLVSFMEKETIDSEALNALSPSVEKLNAYLKNHSNK